MIKIENAEVMGWEAAIRGMRNPMNSWERSDSFCSGNDKCSECPDRQKCDFYFSERGTGRPYRNRFSGDFHYIGPNDRDLMMKLAKGGSVHAKYRRMITVYVDITAPLYWWKEFDTYKVGTVANSCSTMHKIADKKFTREDFSCEHLDEVTLDTLHYLIAQLEYDRLKYLKIKDKKYWWQIIQLLPSSYNQKRTVMLNYEVLAGIYISRKDHKLDEWREFCKWIESLPYSEIITGFEKNEVDS